MAQTKKQIEELQKLKSQVEKLKTQNKKLEEEKKKEIEENGKLETIQVGKPPTESLDQNLLVEVARSNIAEKISKLTEIIDYLTVGLTAEEKRTRKSGKNRQELIEKRDREAWLIREEENRIAELSKQYNLAERRKPISSPIVRWFLNYFTNQKDTCFLVSKIASLQERVKIRKKLQMDLERKITEALKEESTLKATLNQSRLRYDNLQELRIGLQEHLVKMIDWMAESKLNDFEKEILRTYSQKDMLVLSNYESNSDFDERIEKFLEKMNSQTESIKRIREE